MSVLAGASSASAHSTQKTDTAGAARVAAAFGTITSMYRSAAHNRAVGGVADSYHLLGRAIDIVRRHGVTHRQIETALRSAGYVLIESLDEGTHSHFAFAESAAATVPASGSGAAAQSPFPRIAADRHGVLWLDLQPRPRLASPETGSRDSQRARKR